MNSWLVNNEDTEESLEFLIRSQASAFQVMPNSPEKIQLNILSENKKRYLITKLIKRPYQILSNYLGWSSFYLVSFHKMNQLAIFK